MTDAESFERTESSPTWMINHLPVILWQRRYYVLACFLVMLLAGTIVAFATSS